MTSTDIAMLESHLSSVAGEVVEHGKRHAIQLGLQPGPGPTLLALTQVNTSISVHRHLTQLGLVSDDVRRVLLGYQEPPRFHQPQGESSYAIMLELSEIAAASRALTASSVGDPVITTGDLAVGAVASRDPLVDTILLDRQIGLYEAMEALRAPASLLAPKLDVML